MVTLQLFMTEPYISTLRQLRRSAGLTQGDVARILGTGGRSYIAMLESGDRVPHVRDSVLLSMLFGTDERILFPHLYSTTKDMFRSNMALAISDVLKESPPDADRLAFLRDALTTIELKDVVTPQAI